MTDKLLIDRVVLEQALWMLENTKNETISRAARAQEAIEGIRAALEQPQSNSPEIPEGWKLVPAKLTVDMQSAGEAAWAESYSLRLKGNDVG